MHNKTRLAGLPFVTLQHQYYPHLRHGSALQLRREFHSGISLASIDRWQLEFRFIHGIFCPPRLSPDAVSPDQTGMTPALSVDAFPNPKNGHVTVEIAPAAEGMTSLTIVDITGREVFSSAINAAAGYRQDRPYVFWKGRVHPAYCWP